MGAFQGLPQFVTWHVGDIAVDVKGSQWKVLGVDAGNVFEYPELYVELINSPALDGYKDVLSSRLLKQGDKRMSWSMGKAGTKEEVQKYLDEEAQNTIAHVEGVERELADKALELVLDTVRETTGGGYDVSFNAN